MGNERTMGNERSTGVYSSKDGYLNQSPVYGGAMDDFGVTQDEADRYRQDREAIEREALRFGLTASPGAIDMAMDLAAEYTAEWVVEAIRRSVDTPKWAYVKAILRRAKAKGSMDDDRPTSRRTVDQGESKSGKELLEKWGYRDL